MAIELKKISELKNMQFLIPDYQRGYRWTKSEVLSLLKDINDFSQSLDTPWYCLQPLVVKKNKNIYEVIDGQQRLTTIFMILKFIEGENYFNLTYENLDNKVFDKLEDVNINSLNEAYIKDAYKEIRSFKPEEIFSEKLKEYTKFIWYEVEDYTSSIDVFRRLNSGKILLKDVELIKALFLKRTNFNEELSDTIYLRQLEIANEWYEFENKLQNNKFWFFLSNDKDKTDNRIEFIFNLLYDLEKEKSIFDIYYQKFVACTTTNPLDVWEEVKDCFYTLEEWFDDYMIYNTIGYLQTINKKNNIIKEIYEIYKKSAGKNLFKKEIKNKVKKHLKEYINENEEGLGLANQIKGEDDEKIRKILLFHNVWTVNKCQEYFRFDLFKNTKWDIEHIASAGGDRIPNQDKDIETFLENSLQYLEHIPKNVEEKTLLSRIKKIKNWYMDKNTNKEKLTRLFRKLFVKINNYYYNNEIKITMDEKDSEINSISNLVLLDESTNRSYQNNIFPIKRQKIIELDQNGLQEDPETKDVKYLLPCTRNAFLKYYSKDANMPNKWCKPDMESYLKNISDTIKDFIKEDE